MLLSLRFSFSDTHRLIIFINIILKGFSSVYRTKPFFIIIEPYFSSSTEFDKEPKHETRLSINVSRISPASFLLIS